MNILCLDLSTKTGWSVFIDGKLHDWGVISHSISGGYQEGNYPINIVDAAQQIAIDVMTLTKSFRIDIVVTEETNLGKNRYSQKILEFIHCVVCQMLYRSSIGIKYLDSSKWRKLLDLKLDSNQKVNNKKLKTDREMRKAEIGRNWEEENQQAIEQDISGLKPRERNKILKGYEVSKKQYITKEMRKCKSRGKVTFKHLSVQYVNKKFKLELKLKDNDIADSICLGVAYLKQLGELK